MSELAGLGCGGVVFAGLQAGLGEVDVVEDKGGGVMDKRWAAAIKEEFHTFTRPRTPNSLDMKPGTLKTKPRRNQDK